MNDGNGVKPRKYNYSDKNEEIEKLENDLTSSHNLQAHYADKIKQVLWLLFIVFHYIQMKERNKELRNELREAGNRNNNDNSDVKKVRVFFHFYHYVVASFHIILTGNIWITSEIGVCSKKIANNIG